MNRPTISLKSEQSGVVAIIVTLLIMMIMSLIVLAMSQDANREQRQSLDRQLSDQAFYNAETGINDTVAYLYKNPAAPLDNKNSCDPVDVTPTAPSRNIDGSTGANKYTCVLYDKAPKAVQYDSVSLSSPKVIPIETVNDAGVATPISTLRISWDDAGDATGSITDSCNFTGNSPELPASCSYGGIRVELVAPESSRDQIRQRSLSAFLLPNASSGSDLSVAGVAYPDNQGIISQTNCNLGSSVSRRCVKNLTNINRNNFYLSFRSVYRPVNITISGTDASGLALRFRNTQTMVDSTGRANDILRRIQVRIPATNQYDYPGFALQTKDSICKILNVSRNSSGVGSVDSADTGRCPIN